MLAAVIDIGSNTVRLVLYQYNGHHAQPIFNEKLACALGAALVHGTTLDPQAKMRVTHTIQRFRHILDVSRPDYVTAFATAAIRESEDGPDFARTLSFLLGHDVHIIDGLQEAAYSALGVRSACWQAQGLVADLGGGSLDIASLDASGEAKGLLSIPIGALGFAQLFATGGAEAIADTLRPALQQITPHDATMLYLVGGSFRAIAHHHMAICQHPLRIMHHYQLHDTDINALAPDMQHNHLQKQKMPGVPSKRQAYTYPALLVLQALMRNTMITQVTFSSVGVREGALRAARHDDIPYDPLLAMIQAMPEIAEDTHPHRYIIALRAWLLTLIPHTPSQKRLLIAFSFVAELADAIHPEQRAAYAFERMLSTMGYGLEHSEQIVLALALHYRYTHKSRHDAHTALLSEMQHHLAYAMGRAAYIAHKLSAGQEKLLAQYDVAYEDGAVTIHAAGDADIAALPDVQKSCDGLGDAISALSSMSM